MEPSAVLHIASLHGGGVDRHVRDIARGVPRPHLVWHASERAELLELPHEGRALPLDAAALERSPEILERFLRARRIGVLHAHSVGAAARHRAQELARRLALPVIATLHDVLFLRRDAFEPGADPAPDPAWLGQTAQFLRAAAAVLAPSDFIAELARRHVPGLDVRVLPNGSPPRMREVAKLEPRTSFAAHRPRHVAAVLGAIGPHKGSAVLDELDALLAGSGIAIVVIGYLDAQVTPGWRGKSVFVHGAYQDREVPALLRAYGARLALFPNRVPESFSYALSDLWDAGLPVLVPPQGALAERVRRHGGGWLLPEGAGAFEIAAALRERFDARHAAELARVESVLACEDRLRVPRLDDMTRSLDALYARFSIDAAAPVDVEAAPIQQLLAKNLDGALFREEVARLADEVAQLRRSIETERENAKTWIAKLDSDIAALQSELEREVQARRTFAEENRQMRETREAFDRLPSLLRRYLLKRIRDGRG